MVLRGRGRVGSVSAGRYCSLRSAVGLECFHGASGVGDIVLWQAVLVF